MIMLYNADVAETKKSLMRGVIETGGDPDDLNMYAINRRKKGKDAGINS